MNEAQAQNLEGRIAKAEEILKSVRDELSKVKEQPVKRWQPGSNERFLTFDSDGDLSETDNTSRFDKQRIAMGNCFPPGSEDKLSRHVRRIKLMNELFQVALAIDGEKAGVFGDERQNYMLLVYQGTKGTHGAWSMQTANFGTICFSSEAKCKQAWDMISQESRDFLMGK